MSRRELVLVVDDEPSVRDLVRHILSKKYDVLTAQSGKEALELAEKHKPQIVLLDIVMPELDGTEVCKALSESPAMKFSRIIMLTGETDPQFRIKAFNCGADDFIQKPFTPEELLIRVECKVRRLRELSSLGSEKRAGSLVLDLAQMCLRTKSGQIVKLGVIEFKILNMLVTAFGKTVTRKELIEHVWGAGAEKRMLDPHINALRKKLKKTNVEIKTLYGEGYTLIVAQ